MVKGVAVKVTVEVERVGKEVATVVVATVGLDKEVTEVVETVANLGEEGGMENMLHAMNKSLKDPYLHLRTQT